MKHNDVYVGYEYRELRVSGNQLPFYLDCYESLGWEQDDRIPQEPGTVLLRRDHRLPNRAELTRLQRNFEACMDEISRLEASRTSAATACSIALGLIGTAFMAGSVFAVTAEVPLIALCVLLAIPGFAGWAAAPFLFRSLKKKRDAVVDRLTENKYHEVYEICEKGHRLLE